MRKLLMILMCILTVTIAMGEGTSTASAFIVEDIGGIKLEFVYPDNYNSAAGNYKVLINLYDRKTNVEKRRWLMKEAAAKAGKIGNVDNVIYAGIDMTGNVMKKYNYIFDTLIPVLKEKYGVMQGDENILIAGSGEASTDIVNFILAGKPFRGMVLLMSPAYFSYTKTMIEKLMNTDRIETKIWISSGTKQWQPDEIMMTDMFEGKGLIYGESLFLYEGIKEGDNDKSWTNLVKYPVKYFSTGKIGKECGLEIQHLEYAEENGDLYSQINAIVEFESEIKYSAYNKAAYTITDGEISEKGTIFPSENSAPEVTVSYGSLKKSIIIEEKNK